ncbi:hypothetical protein A0H81_13019 [Grifola frondosa]|uniref:EGF domain-specific O-linked N-acetylglucosamine transferase n=1 Tax=Grifola frondosa TaxID=5627 RepID=A0A1C7LR38_GRIFR|nr:hypothetical protein A0H81_13019 [Grifola frondosa]
MRGTPKGRARDGAINTQDKDSGRVKDKPPQESLQSLAVTPIDLSYDFPETTIVSHAPGWTVFRHLYMSNGTLFIVTSQPVSSFPDISLITSTGLTAENTPENIAAECPHPMICPSLLQHRRRSAGRRPRQVGAEPRLYLLARGFWSGAFNAVVNPSSAGMTTAPPVHRAIFAHAGAYGWRDRPGFNAYVFRAAFPSLTVEVEEDWEDRIRSTSTRMHPDAHGTLTRCSFPIALRRSGGPYAGRAQAPYRLSSRCARRGVDGLVYGEGWELNVVQAERLTKEQQLALAARTTVMLGVHGNGLTHLIMMPVTPISTVIEIFYPGGFAHDYQWTTHALGMRHFAIWNDTSHTARMSHASTTQKDFRAQRSLCTHRRW